ncbi:hypothetical protein HNR12_001876 [Streptomonospora nanhaiensis]|uniref:Lipoprotein n=1 Tax=Streptomonospora nanhaiensis TaxID=1323731 RepID=A0A853BJF3_9ACTN|nr:hypothetical protein [Streptomonospora nanhaiensis]NYI95599.1 hypothetical protein [Streptomonospora nanhaiensis]
MTRATRRMAAGMAAALCVAVLSSCVGASGGPEPQGTAVPTPGDASDRTELAEAVTAALDAEDSAAWRLQSFDSSGMATLNSGRLSCSGDGSGVYRVDGDATRYVLEPDFVPGRDYEGDETSAADVQASGSVATDDGLHSASGGDFWPLGDDYRAADIPSDYLPDLTAARGANCSHITAALAVSTDLRLVDAVEVDGTPTAHWSGTAYIDDLREHAVGFARSEYTALVDMGLGEAAVDVELWVDDANRPLVYYQHLPPDRTGLQNRWFALTLTDWSTDETVTAP